jgi:DNA-binding MarR family transcriptional regulator
MARIKGDHPAHVAALAERMERDLSAIHHAMRIALKAEVAKGELTGPQTAVMRIVVRTPGVSLRDLSREVSLAHSTVSGIVDRLEKRGLVERNPDQADRRIMRVRPTATITTWMEERLPVLKMAPLQAALHRANPEEREALANAVTRLRGLLTAPEEPSRQP